MEKCYYIKVIENHEPRTYEVTFQTEEIQEFRDKIVDQYSLIEHHKHKSYQEPYFPGEQEYRKFAIRNLHKSYSQGIDTWPLIESSYDKYTYPYIVRILDTILNKDGDEEEDSIRDAILELMEPNVANEYEPIQELINHYSYDVVEGYCHNEENPGYQYTYPYEIRSALEYLPMYVNLLLDEKYKEQFREVYKEALDLLSIIRVKFIYKEKEEQE